MLTLIKQFFSAELEISQGGSESTLQLAAAALLIELAHADAERDEQEQQTLKAALKTSFSLTEEQLSALIELAEQEAQEATSLYQFTRLINDHYSPEQKVQLIEMMWKVALADGEVCKYEDHLIRKIAELLYVSHSDFIRTKLKIVGN